MKVNEKLSILFLLEKSKVSPDGTCPITCRITIDSVRKELSTGKRIKPEVWDQNSGFAKGNSKEAINTNSTIRRITTKLTALYDSLANTTENSFVTTTQLKDSYQGKDIQKVEEKSLLEAVEFVVSRMEKRVAKNKRAHGTLVKWRTTKSKIESFIKFQYNRPDLPLSKVEYAFAEDFSDYLQLEGNLQNNTAMKYVKHAKHVIKTAVERNWLLKSPISGFVCPYINPERDILDEAEILAVYNKKLPSKRLEEIRDCYIFMVFTGYAYKDVLNLSPDNVCKYFDGEDWIIKNREKTWCRENVPLLPIAKEIIEKYKNHPLCLKHNRLLPIKSNQKFNDYLKEVMDIVNIVKNLTTHTARHTFATTITLANGVPIETVSALLGHKSIRTTQIYAKIVAAKVSSDMKVLKEKLLITMMPNSLMTETVAA